MLSQQLISHNRDLRKLRDEGYNIDIIDGYLVVFEVPYVNSNRQISIGELISHLELTGDVTSKPQDHVAHFTGEYPCDFNGNQLTKLVNSTSNITLSNGLVTKFSFSSKPPSGYLDYFEKMSTLVKIISNQARAIDQSATACTYPVIFSKDDQSPFHYIDNASSRYNVTTLSKKLELRSVGIIGLGGTGSYILDLIAKTPIKEINIFDGDDLLQHNAFRYPGAVSVEELQQKIKKVDYLKTKYSKMHRNIIAHSIFIDCTNLDQIQDLDFVFICMDSNNSKRIIIDRLIDNNTDFIDVGMGIEVGDNNLFGLLRVTACTTAKRDHALVRMNVNDDIAENEYSSNIQIADLNALNAALAVIKWKKLCGYYYDPEQEHHSCYVLDGNVIINDEKLI